MIVRAEKRKSYTRVSNSIFRDPRLNATSAGLLMYMLSKPDDWVFYKKNLQDMTGLGRDALEKNLKALERAGYLTRGGMIRGPTGAFVSADWTVYEESVIPWTDMPGTVHPDTGRPCSGKPHAGKPDTRESLGGIPPDGAPSPGKRPLLKNTQHTNKSLKNNTPEERDPEAVTAARRTRKFNNAPSREYDMAALEIALLKSN